MKQVLFPGLLMGNPDSAKEIKKKNQNNWYTILCESRA